MMKRTVLTLALLGSLASPLYAAEDVNKPLLTAYGKVRAALAADDLEAAKKAATPLAEKAVAVKNDALAKAAKSLAESKDIDAARAEFRTISEKVIPLVKGLKGYYVVFCPMAKASWVQTDKAVQNPYYGKSMLSCGEVQGGDDPGTPKKPSGCGQGCGM
jgi:hypothetical protein